MGRRGAGIRFGIRWDRGRRPKRGLAAPAASRPSWPGSGRRRAPRPAPLAPAPVDVVVVADPGRMDAAERVTVRLGGAVGEPLRDPRRLHRLRPERRAIARLEASGAVQTPSAATRAMHARSTSGSDTANESADVDASRRPAASDSAFDGAGVDVAVLDSGVVPARRPRGAGHARPRPGLLLGARFRPRARRARHLRPRHAHRRRDRRPRPAQRLPRASPPAPAWSA